MKAVLLALCLSLVSMEAYAISRYNSTSMGCNEVKATVRSEGAVILRWRSKNNPNLPRYGRFVANNSYCRLGERAERSYVPSADRNSCPVLECKYYDPHDELLFRLHRR